MILKIDHNNIFLLLMNLNFGDTYNGRQLQIRNQTDSERSDLKMLKNADRKRKEKEKEQIYENE